MFFPKPAQKSYISATTVNHLITQKVISTNVTPESDTQYFLAEMFVNINRFTQSMCQ